MGDIDSLRFDKLLNVVKRASTDSERFAALLVVSKSTSSHSLNSDQRKELFGCIGLSFPIRLLMTAAKDDCIENKSAYASIGANTVLAYCTDDEFINRNEVQDVIPHILKLIDQLSRDKNNENCKVLLDCYDCMIALSSNEKCLTKMLECNIIKSLCESDETEKSFTLLATILAKQNKLWEEEAELLNGYMAAKCSIFKSDNSEQKFVICHGLFSMLITVPVLREGSSKNEWQNDLLYGVRQILCSKVKAEKRKDALLLATEIVRLFGLKRMFSECTDNFPVVLLRLACIETGLLLREIKQDGFLLAKNYLAVLLACSSFIKQFCSCIATFEQNEEGHEDILSFKQIQMTQYSLSDLMNCISNFVKAVLNSEISSQTEICLQAVVRVLGSWLNVEYNVNSAQGKELLPIIVEILKLTLKTKEISLLKFTLPAIMISLENIETKAAILNENILRILKDLLQLLVEDYTFSKDQEGTQAMHFVVQAIIGVNTVLSSEECTQHTDTLEALFTVFARTLSTQPQDLSLESLIYLYTGSLVTMNLMCKWKHNDKTKDLLQKSLQFFSQVFVIDKDGKLHKNERFNKIWNEISDLWMIGMKEIIKLIKSYPELAKVIQDQTLSSHLRHLTDAAQTVKDEELFSVFRELAEFNE